MIIKALIPRGIRFRTLRTIREETQRSQSTLDGGGPRDESPFDTNRVGGEREAGGGYTGGRGLRGLVSHQAVGGIDFVFEVSEGFTLQRLNLCPDDTVHFVQLSSPTL